MFDHIKQNVVQQQPSAGQHQSAVQQQQQSAVSQQQSAGPQHQAAVQLQQLQQSAVHLPQQHARMYPQQFQVGLP